MIKIILLLFIVSMTSSCRLTLNLGTVERGQLYRSAQPTPNDIKQLHKRYGIKTIINLRGVSTKERYIEEAKISKQLGINLVDIGMSAQRLPHKKDLIKLLDAFANAPRPILIHCQGGADRTGEAVAIYMMEYLGKSKEYALKHGTALKHFHLEKRMPAKRYFIRSWKGLDWAYNDYDPCNYDQHYDQRQCVKGIPESFEDIDDDQIDGIGAKEFNMYKAALKSATN